MKFFLSLCLLTTYTAYAKIEYPDFDTSMLRKGLFLDQIKPGFNEENRMILENRDQYRIKFFRDLYNRNIDLASEDQELLRIPKIIHQIWIGSPVPDRLKQWMESWSQLSGWEYKLWTDLEIAELPMHNRDLFEESVNFGEKSDIARLEILNQFGGVYVDTDVECLQPEIFDELHHSFDFYIGFDPLEHGFTYKFNMLKFCNAVIGSIPGHPLLHDLVINLKANYRAYQTCCTAIQKTGPSYLTRIICEYEENNLGEKRNMYLPCTFFYTVSEPEMRFFMKHPNLTLPLLPETAGFHYWIGSWWRDVDGIYCGDTQ